MEEGGINCGQLPFEQQQRKPSGNHFSCLGRPIQQKQTAQDRCAVLEWKGPHQESSVIHHMGNEGKHSFITRLSLGGCEKRLECGVYKSMQVAVYEMRKMGDSIYPETPEDKITATVLTEKVRVFPSDTCSELNGCSSSGTSMWKK